MTIHLFLYLIAWPAYTSETIIAETEILSRQKHDLSKWTFETIIVQIKPYLLVGNVIAAADLANDVVQTGIMAAELATSKEANRIAGTANDLTKEQIRQDMTIALKQMRQERDLSDANEKLLRELSSDMIDALHQISESIDDVAVSIRKGNQF